MEQRDAPRQREQPAIAGEPEQSRRDGLEAAGMRAAVRALRVDLLGANAPGHPVRRRRDEAGPKKNKRSENEVAAGAHRAGRESVADRGEAGVAPEPFPD